MTKKIILFNKPYDVLCQFTSPDGSSTLADYIDAPDFYAAGRLDKDSEGLLILTDNGQIQQQLTNPRYKLPKTYWAQVEGQPTEESLEPLRHGIQLNDGWARPAKVHLLAAPEIWPRNPPIRYRKNVPTGWVSITLTEGRNRQVRRMTAAIGFPTLRLVRISIGNWQLGDLKPGEWAYQSIK